MHFRSVCLIINVSANKIGLGFSYDAFNFRMTYVHAFFVHMFFLSFPILSMCCVLLCSLSLSLSLSDRLRHGTQTAQIHSGSKPSSRFRVIFFFYPSCTLSFLVPWWEGQDGLHWELRGPWRSSGMLGLSVGFLQHYATRCHSDSRMGISMWETRALSLVFI